MKTINKHLSKSLYLLIAVILLSVPIDTGAQGKPPIKRSLELIKVFKKAMTQAVTGAMKDAQKDTKVKQPTTQQGESPGSVTGINSGAPQKNKWKPNVGNQVYESDRANKQRNGKSQNYRQGKVDQQNTQPQASTSIVRFIAFASQFDNFIDNIIIEYCDTLSENQRKWVKRNIEIEMYNRDFRNISIPDYSYEMEVKNLLWLQEYAEALAKDMQLFDWYDMDLVRQDFSTESLWPENFEELDRNTFFDSYRSYIDELISAVSDSLRPGQEKWIKRNSALVSFHRLFDFDEMTNGLPNEMIIKDLLWVLGYLDRISMNPQPDLDLDDDNSKLDLVVWILSQQMKLLSNYDVQ